ncbi:MAG: hypothetical protein L3J20_11150 [Flavobacteriaceae bacterium]|nr:hypothetical protein [Flavobacteriaceae bacterium]
MLLVNLCKTPIFGDAIPLNLKVPDWSGLFIYSNHLAFRESKIPSPKLSY